MQLRYLTGIYNKKAYNQLRATCMQLLFFQEKRALKVAAKMGNQVFFNLEITERVLILFSNIPKINVLWISNFFSKSMFCCDANQNILKFFTNSE